LGIYLLEFKELQWKSAIFEKIIDFSIKKVGSKESRLKVWSVIKKSAVKKVGKK